MACKYILRSSNSPIDDGALNSHSNRPTVLCKIVGIYEIGVHNRVTGKRTMEQVAVMQNIFYNRKISRMFDLKGSLRGRFAAQIRKAKAEEGKSMDASESTSTGGRRKGEETDDTEATSTDEDASETGTATLLDGDFLEFTMGRPMPMTDRAKAVFQMSILNVRVMLPRCRCDPRSPFA